MELHQIRYFKTIAEEGSFSRAAAKLFLSQPALSKSMAKLEEELGTPLFERNGSRIALTTAGKTFLNYSGNILNDVESSINAVKESVGLKTGHVSIAITSEIFIKHLIYKFLNDNPDASLTCHLMSYEEMPLALDEGTIDFALSGERIVSDRITWDELYSGNYTAVLNPKDSLFGKKSIKMSQLKDHSFCIGHLSEDLQSSIYTLCKDAGFSPKIRYLGYDPEMAGKSVIISSEIIDKCIKGFSMGSSYFPSAKITDTKLLYRVGISKRLDHYQSETAAAFYDMVEGFFRGF